MGRQADKHMGRQAGKRVGCEAGKHLGRQAGKHMGCQEGKHVGCQGNYVYVGPQEGNCLGCQAGNHVGRQEGRHMGRHEGNHMGRQEEKHMGCQEGNYLERQAGNHVGRQGENRWVELLESFFFVSVGCLEILARWRSLTIMLHQFRFQTMDWTFHMKIHGFLSILPLNHGLGPQFFGKNVVLPGSEKLWTISHNMNQYDLSFSRTTFGVPFFQTFKSGNTKLSFGPVQEWSWTGQSQDENSQASQRQCHHCSACETKPTDVLVRINMNKLILIEYFKKDFRCFQNHS